MKIVLEPVKFLIVFGSLTGAFVVADKLVETNFSPADVLLAGILLYFYLRDGYPKKN